MNDSQNDKQFLQYTGNKIPQILRFAWTILFVFVVYYCTKYMWPDLVEWMNKIK